MHLPSMNQMVPHAFLGHNSRVTLISALAVEVEVMLHIKPWPYKASQSTRLEASCTARESLEMNDINIDDLSMKQKHLYAIDMRLYIGLAVDIGYSCERATRSSAPVSDYLQSICA